MKRYPVLVLIIFSLFIHNLYAQSLGSHVSPPSGSYNRDQRVIIKQEKDLSLEIAFKGNPFDRRVLYEGPILLTALPGEERVYEARVFFFKGDSLLKEEEFTWIIDKKIPGPPLINPDPGNYQQDVSVRFLNPEKERVYYSINGRPEDAVPWDGRPIRLPARRGILSEYYLYAYLKDPAGNLGRPEVFRYQVGTQERTLQDLAILSPIPGDYKNPQLLYLQKEDYVWVKYLLGSGDVVKDGTDYTAPVEIRNRGDVLLSIAALPYGTDRPIIKTIKYTVEQETENSIKPNPPQGIYPGGLEILVERPGYYTFEDRPPIARDFPLPGKIPLEGIYNGLRVISISYSESPQSRTSYYRWTYIIDSRIPLDPVLILDSTEPLSGDTFASFSGSRFASIFYTLDGSSPDRNSNRYSFPFRIPVPETGTGSLVVKSVAFTPSGMKSKSISSIIHYDREIPLPPRLVSLEPGSEPGSVQIQVEADYGCSLIYEMTLNGRIPKDPGRESSEIPGSFLISLPVGMERIFTLKLSSKDRAGNISSPAEPISFIIDRVPPLKPQINVNNGAIVITGEKPIYYTLTTDGTIPALPTERSRTFSSPIQLQAGEGEHKIYTLLARSQDLAGNWSETSSLFTVTVDNRTPLLPEFSGIKDGGIYNSRVELYFKDSHSEVLYSLTEDGTLPVLNENSESVVDKKLSFSGKMGEEILYRLLLIPRYKEKIGKGEEISFTVDLKPPRVPEPVGFTKGGFYRNAVRAGIKAAEPGVEYFCVFGTDPETLSSEDLFQPGNRFSGEKVFDVSPGEEKTYYLLLGAMDFAGNRVISPDVFFFTLDKIPPEAPVILGVPMSGLSNQDLELIISGKDQVRYELGQGGKKPNNPTINSPEIQGSLKLSAKEGEEVTYSILFSAFDKAGNISSKTTLLNITLDKKAPPEPPKPILKSGNRNSLNLAWEIDSNYTLLYSLEEGDWMEYKGPFSVLQSTNLKYCYQDKAGNRSSVQRIFLALPMVPVNLISGITQNGLYNQTININPASNALLLRYELGTLKNPPLEPDIHSPILEKAFSLTCNTGETIDFILKVKAYPSTEDTISLKSETYYFTIDRLPPSPPAIIGITDNAHYQTDKVVSLSSEKDQIYFTVLEDYSAPKEEDYRLYRGPITLKTEQGKLGFFRILAYTLDQAGNRSRETMEWRAYIDKAIIYVSNTGDDNGDGTRARPLRTLDKALEVAVRLNRNSIYLSEGIHYLRQPLIIQSDLRILGGFSSDSWTQDEKNYSVLQPSPGFASSQELILLKSGTLHLKQIALSDVKEQTKYLFSQISGNATFESLLISREGGFETGAINIRGGTFLLRNSTVMVQDSRDSKAIVCSDGQLTLEGVYLGAQNIQDTLSLLYCFSKSVVILKNSVLLPGKAKTIKVIEATDSQITLENSTVSNGEAAVKSTSLFSNRSIVNVRDSEFKLREVSRITIAIESWDSAVSILRSEILCSASIGATAVQSNGGSLEIILSKVKGSPTKEFMYLFLLRNSRARFLTNLITTDSAQDTLILTSQGSETVFINNTMLLQNPGNTVIGFLINSPTQFSFINNILIKEPSFSVKSEAFTVSGELKNLELLNNNIAGFEHSLIVNNLKMNLIEREEPGINIMGNISQTAEETFLGDGSYRLKTDSASIDSGRDVRIRGGLNRDWEGKIRPNPDSPRPAFDLGIYEY